MIHVILGFIFLSNVFAEGFCREFEVYYEVNDFGELAEARFQINHGIVKRSVSAGNVSSTADPTSSMKTTPNFLTHPRISNSNTTNASLPTGKPSGTPNAWHSTNQTASYPPTKTAPTATPQYKSTTRFPITQTTPVGTVPVNNTNGTNITIIEDNHDYFKSHYYPSGKRWWFDLNDGSGTPILHVGLTKNLQYSDTIRTSFVFPYYGHESNQVTITNKGFLFLGRKLHKFNASMQYVAPLMADFGAHLHNETSIHYVDTGDRFTVEWKNLRLQNQQAGDFSFQCSILKNGTIVFAYRNVPVAVSEIKNTSFPVRVGLSDSFVLRYLRHGFFIIDRKLYFRIRYIVYYRYHQVKLQQEQVKNGSAFVITPLPNCVVFKSCESCVSSDTQFSCKWCPRLRRCSDGFDRHRQSWLVNGCHRNSRTTCPRTTPTSHKTGSRPTRPTMRETSATTNRKGDNQKTKSRRGSSSNKSAATAVIIIFCLLIIIAVACWVAYAYTHPLSKSGMFLMQYGNPRKWCRNSGSESGGGKITFKSMPHESTA